MSIGFNPQEHFSDYNAELPPSTASKKTENTQKADNAEKTSKLKSFFLVLFPPHVNDAIELKIAYWVFKVISKLPKPISIFITAPVVKESIAIPGLLAGTLTTAVSTVKVALALRMIDIWKERFDKKDAPFQVDLTQQANTKDNDISVKNETENSSSLEFGDEQANSLSMDNENITLLSESTDRDIFLQESEIIEPEPIEDIYEEQVPSEQGKIIHELLKKRKESQAEAAKTDPKREEFFHLLDEIGSSTEDSLDMIDQLKEWHINLDIFFAKHPDLVQEIKNQENEKTPYTTVSLITGPRELTLPSFREAVKNPNFREALYVEHCEHRDTHALLTRKALKTLAAKKLEVERPSFQFRIATSGISLVSSICLTTALIVVKSLLIAGVIAVPALVSTLTGGFALGLGVSLMAAGILYLVINKPETVRKTVTSIKADCISYIHGYRRWSLRRTENKIAKLRKKHEDLVLNPQANQLLDKIQHKIDRLLPEREVRAAKFAYWDRMMQGYKRTLSEAGWQDFMKQTKFSNLTVSPEAHDLADELAAHILDPHSGIVQDAETVEVLKERMGIDLAAVIKDAPADQMRQEVAFAIRKFGGMTQGETEKFIIKKFRDIERENRRKRKQAKAESAQAA